MGVSVSDVLIELSATDTSRGMGQPYGIEIRSERLILKIAPAQQNVRG